MSSLLEVITCVQWYSIYQIYEFVSTAMWIRILPFIYLILFNRYPDEKLFPLVLQNLWELVQVFVLCFKDCVIVE